MRATITAPCSLFVVVIAAILAAACDPSGTTLRAANDWNEDVIVVARVAGGSTSVRVPAGAWGTVLNTWGRPTQEHPASAWVYDQTCALRASLQITDGESTIHVSVDGAAVVESDWRAEPGAARSMLNPEACP